MKTRVLKYALTASLLVWGAFPATAQDKPQVVSVNYALQYFAERLLGDEADVTLPVPQDVDPSFWRPSIADIGTIQSADLIILNGAGFATWVDRVSLPRSKIVNTTAAIEDQFIRTESITHSHGDGDEHSHEGLATYIWLDPSLAVGQAEAIAAALTARGVGSADQIAVELDALRADLETLDATTQAALAGLIDVAIITTHPRYQYFAKRYGLTVSALEWEAGAAPNAAEVADLAALMEQTGAQMLIWEAAPPAEALAMASDLGLKNIVFPPLAQSVAGRDYLQVFEEAVAKMSEVNTQ